MPLLTVNCDDTPQDPVLVDGRRGAGGGGGLERRWHVNDWTQQRPEWDAWFDMILRWEDYRKWDRREGRVSGQALSGGHTVPLSLWGLSPQRGDVKGPAFTFAGNAPQDLRFTPKEEPALLKRALLTLVMESSITFVHAKKHFNFQWNLPSQTFYRYGEFWISWIISEHFAR